MKDLNRKAQVYIVGTVLVGLGVLVWELLQYDRGQIWPTLALGGLGSMALIFKVEGSTSRSHYNISFLVYAFTFVLLGPEATILVMVVANLSEWIWYRYPWYIPTFNIFSHIIVLYVAGVIYRALGPSFNTFDIRDVVSLFVSLAAFTICNHLMVGLVIWFARGENFKQSGIFSFFPLMLDFILLCMGASVALIWMVSPYAIVFVLLPLYLIYTTLRVPALERQSETDPKTGIFNARYFEQALQSELHRSNRFDRPLTIVMADLDLLRNINNTYGHLAGDEVLIGIARILKNSTREYDVVARFGGEEFAILLPETRAKDALVHVEAIRKAIEMAEFSVQTSVTPIKATMSFGIAERDGFDQTYKDIIHNADAALYHSKLKGRNQVFVYSEEGYVNLFQQAENTRPRPNPEDIQPATPVVVSSQPVPGSKPVPLQDGSGRQNGGNNHNKQVNHHSQITSLLLFVGMTAASLLLFAVLYRPDSPVNWIGILAFAALVVLTEWLSIDIYLRDTAISTSGAPLIAGFLMFGPISAPILGLTLSVVAMLKHDSKPIRFFFNLSNQMLAGLLCIGLMQFGGVVFTNLASWQQFIMSILAAVIVYMSTTWLIAMGMGLEFDLPIKDIWVEKFSWLAPYYFSMGVIAYALIFSFTDAGLLGLLVILVPLMMLRLSQTQYIEKTKAVVEELRGKNLALQNSSDEILKLNEGLLNALAEVVDLRDPYVLGHSKQVARVAEMLAVKLGLAPKQVELMHKAGLLHDIGKLGISEAILFKPGKLTAYEYGTIKRHVTLGAEILQTSHSLHSLIPIIRHHHEHYNGGGYPNSLSGSDIPIEARILAVADAVEAMASDRPYRQGRNIDGIINELNRCAGTQFDPLVVNAFVELAQEYGEALITNSARKIEFKEDAHAWGLSHEVVWARQAPPH